MHIVKKKYSGMENMDSEDNSVKKKTQWKKKNIDFGKKYIYIHRGKKQIVEKIDIIKKKCIHIHRAKENSKKNIEKINIAEKIKWKTYTDCEERYTDNGENYSEENRQFEKIQREIQIVEKNR